MSASATYLIRAGKVGFTYSQHNDASKAKSVEYPHCELGNPYERVNATRRQEQKNGSNDTLQNQKRKQNEMKCYTLF